MIVAAQRAGVERHEMQVAAALGAIDVRPPEALLWFGRRVAVSAGERLVDAVTRQLLADFFAGGAPRPRRAGPLTALGDGGGFVRALSQSNCGRGTWQDGWRVDGEDGEDAIAVVRADGLRMLAPADAVDGSGATARVRVPKELTGHRLGSYIALGDRTPGADAELATLYWSIAPAGAVTLVARVTYALNRAGLPFELTLVDNPARYGSAEPAALSLVRTDVERALALMRPLLRALATHLADSAPAFCKPLARGLAFAEQPSGPASFGEHRCRLLAEAIVSAREAGLRAPDQRLAVVRERFAAAGVSLDAPYLHPRSADALPRS